MRLLSILFVVTLLFFTENVKCQSVVPFGTSAYQQKAGSLNNIIAQDSLSNKKWFLSKYRGISTGISFYKGGNATFLAAPFSLQLNRKLNNNLYAFANVAVVPAFFSFNSTIPNSGPNKFFPGNSFRSNSFNVNPSASLGLMYVNDAKTFSISGSISAERSSYPVLPYYPPVNRNTPLLQAR